MADLSNYVVRHFIGGGAVFSGVFLCLLGCCLKWSPHHTRLRTVARATVLAGAILVACSAAPFPLWAYAAFFVLVALAVFKPAARLWQSKKADLLVLVFLFVQSLVMVGTEMACSRPPTIEPGKGDILFVVGDSISMGADPPGKNWPELLGDLVGLKVRNFSFGGAKAESALANAARINEDNALVLLEIGGNDLLGGTSIPKFRQDLDQMLTLVCRTNRSVAMIELPLPPFYNRYGMVQRALARSHKVTLIPKCYLAKVITTQGATVDGLHLSNAGHALLARSLSDLLVRPVPGG